VLLGFLGAGLDAVAATPPGAVAVSIQATPRGRSPRVLTAWERGGVLYFSAGDLSALFGTTKY
jgi:hypothetical protein